MQGLAYSIADTKWPKKHTMQALKDIKSYISVKNPETRPPATRLPPLLTAPSVITSSKSVLAPIPSISITNTANETPPPADLSYSSSQASLCTQTTRNNQETSFSSTTQYNSSDQKPAALHNSQDRGSAVSHTSQHVGSANLFMTSHTSSQQTHSTKPTRANGDDGDETLNNQPMGLADRVKANGVRTYPVLAVLSIFLCCPLTGLIAALLSLRAENSFYQQHYILAQKEAFVARICLLLSYLTGIVGYIALVIVFSVI